MKPYNISILMPCPAHGVFRGCLQGKPDGLQVPLGGFHLCSEVDKYSEIPFHLEASQTLFLQKLYVCLSSTSNIMQRFSIQSVKKGSLVGLWSVSLHADRVG